MSSHGRPRQNLSSQYQNNIKQKSDGNKEKYQIGDYWLIHHQILLTKSIRMHGRKKGELLWDLGSERVIKCQTWEQKSQRKTTMMRPQNHSLRDFPWVFWLVEPTYSGCLLCDKRKWPVDSEERFEGERQLQQTCLV